MVACRAHAPKDAGSNPASNKILIKIVFQIVACITQLVRVLGCDPRSHGFKSRYTP